MDNLEKSDYSLIKSAWPILFTVIVAALLAIRYSMKIDESSYSPGDGMGLLYGILALALILFLSGYRIRKSLLRASVGSLHSWAQSHVYIGVILIVVVFLHSGFRTGGALSGLLLTLFLLVTASGAIGAILYKVVPLSLSKYGKHVMTMEVIGARFEKLLAEADKQAENRSDKFMETYNKHIRPSLASHGVKWGYIFFDEEEVIKACREKMEALQLETQSDEVYGMSLVGAIYMEKERLSHKWAMLNSLRVWLYLHVPLTMALLVALSFHILGSFYY
ncbi:MAG: hypothetical protein OEY50_03095 [Nitrospinota bacterium]|nr:hypothetical protein [Nitrospinota bacterium]MDH5677755.1 hypothetical protein [Nitrospinota bacterium]